MTDEENAALAGAAEMQFRYEALAEWDLALEVAIDHLRLARESLSQSADVASGAGIERAKIDWRSVSELVGDLRDERVLLQAELNEAETDYRRALHHTGDCSAGCRWCS